ncbi:protein translocase subunit SecF [Photobacterium leiognathi]|uniref:protein translocase subunit SecF n=1 Tax=Photobacterium leiognathi TaxID=553611 RepID=UPI0029819611|nr:protein translocase subunit SecF [Photobacterium leiognathi]
MYEYLYKTLGHQPDRERLCRLPSLLFALGLIYLVIASIQGTIFKYGVEFAGGTELSVKWEPKDDYVLRETLRKLGVGFSVSGGDRQGIIIVTNADDDKKTIDKIKQKFGQNIYQERKISSSLGEMTAQKTLVVVGVTFCTIFLYLAVRLNLFMALSCIAALIFDLVAVLTLISFLDIVVSLPTIGAVLAIAGYSINDSVVVSSKIKQLQRRNPQIDLSLVTDQALIDTLRRSIRTSVSTILVAICISVFSEPPINHVGIIIIAGVFFGTFSSLFIVPLINRMTGLKSNHLIPELTPSKNGDL